ncbi:hypothetical protein B0O99DRAFT_686045 [Bisporella sp. PMI_857]|nr:hypothetical protein B0O99DRAFT_686045 [Bisporella sp. PMI_857]
MALNPDMSALKAIEHEDASSVTSTSTSSIRARQCRVCKEGQSLPVRPLVTCNSCNSRWHPYCHEPKILGHSPSSNWKCSRCTGSQAARGGVPISMKGQACEIAGCKTTVFGTPSSGTHRSLCKIHQIQDRHNIAKIQKRTLPILEPRPFRKDKLYPVRLTDEDGDMELKARRKRKHVSEKQITLLGIQPERLQSPPPVQADVSVPLIQASSTLAVLETTVENMYDHDMPSYYIDQESAFDPSTLDSFLHTNGPSEVLLNQQWGHIDPRAQWPQKHSDVWVENKTTEIESRGSRKANFGLHLTVQALETRRANGWRSYQSKNAPENEKSGALALKQLFGINFDNYDPFTSGGKLFMRERSEGSENSKKRRMNVYPVAY